MHLCRFQNPDRTWEDLPTWQEVYAALDYESAPDDIKEVILVARRDLALENIGISPYVLYSKYLPDLHNPDLSD